MEQFLLVSSTELTSPNPMVSSQDNLKEFYTLASPGIANMKATKDRIMGTH